MQWLLINCLRCVRDRIHGTHMNLINRSKANLFIQTVRGKMIASILYQVSLLFVFDDFDKCVYWCVLTYWCMVGACECVSLLHAWQFIEVLQLGIHCVWFEYHVQSCIIFLHPYSDLIPSFFSPFLHPNTLPQSYFFCLQCCHYRSGSGFLARLLGAVDRTWH